MTKSSVNPYIFFNGRCEEAIQFYQKAVGAEQQMLLRYKDAPPGAMDKDCETPAQANQVMHARLTVGGTTVMMSDGPCSGKYDGFSLSVTAPTPADAQKMYAALSAGGNADMPINKTFFSPAFGMLTDKFGIKWMVMAEQGK